MLKRSWIKRGAKPLQRKTRMRSKNPERQKRKKAEYAAHLKSVYWKILRCLTWQRDEGVCQQCHITLDRISDMQLAHRTYARFGHEIMDDVEVNCTACNQAERASRSWYKGNIT